MPRSAATIVYLLIGCMYFTWAPPLGTSLPFIPANIADTMFTPAHSVIRAIGFQPSMTRVVQILFTMHAFESIYTWYLCRRYVKGSFVKVSKLKYVFSSPRHVDVNTVSR